MYRHGPFPTTFEAITSARSIIYNTQRSYAKHRAQASRRAPPRILKSLKTLGTRLSQISSMEEKRSVVLSFLQSVSVSHQSTSTAKSSSRKPRDRTLTEELFSKKEFRDIMSLHGISRQMLDSAVLDRQAPVNHVLESVPCAHQECNKKGTFVCGGCGLVHYCSRVMAMTLYMPVSSPLIETHLNTRNVRGNISEFTCKVSVLPMRIGVHLI